MDAQENLNLSVANFGPIAKAEIDLRPLTVFVGPGNTGKSYLTILIYALHKFFGGPHITSLRYRYDNRTIFDRRYGFEDPTITTHSEWVMDELANLVYLSHLPKSKRDGISGAEFALKPSQVGYLAFDSVACLP